MDDAKKQLFQALSLLVLILAVLALARIFVEIRTYKFIGQGSMATPTITVSGEAEEFAKPDVADLSFAVLTEAADVAAAQDKNTDITNKVMAFLKAEGIAEKDIQTTGYVVNPRYIYPNQIQKLAAYQVTHNIKVIVRDIDKAGNILAGVGKLGVTNVSGPNLRVEDKAKVMATARAKAIIDAETKAEVLANDLGVKLVRVVSFSEDGYPPVFFGRMEAFGVGGDSMAKAVPEIAPGENLISARVTVTYEIR